jgi:phenylalanyl-tRNA synthetase beta chain
LPGLLKALKRNVSHRLENLRLYEVGKTFTPVPGQELPREDLRLSGLAAGARYAQLWHFQRGEIDERGKIDKAMEVDFYDVKGPLETLLEGMGVENATFRPSKCPFLHPGKSADMFVNDEYVGFLGELSPAKTREHDLDGKIQIFEIFLEPLLIQYRKERAFKPIPRYPYIERDLSVIVEEKVSGDLIKHLISRLGHDIICSVILFDIYRGESIPANHKSMAFRIRYQSDERTLKDEEVEGVHAQVVAALTKEVGAALRE